MLPDWALLTILITAAGFVVVCAIDMLLGFDLLDLPYQIGRWWGRRAKAKQQIDRPVQDPAPFKELSRYKAEERLRTKVAWLIAYEQCMTEAPRHRNPVVAAIHAQQLDAVRRQLKHELHWTEEQRQKDARLKRDRATAQLYAEMFGGRAGYRGW